METIPEDSDFLDSTKKIIVPARKESNAWVKISQQGSNLLVSDKSLDMGARRQIKGKILETLETFRSDFHKNRPEVSPEILKNTIENISTIENFLVTEDDVLVYYTWEDYQKHDDVELFIWNLKSLITHISQRKQSNKLQTQVPLTIGGNTRSNYMTPVFLEGMKTEVLP